MSTRIVILIEGGVAQAAWADGPIEVAVYDMDNVDAGEPPLCAEWARIVVEEDTTGFDLVF